MIYGDRKKRKVYCTIVLLSFLLVVIVFCSLDNWKWSQAPKYTLLNSTAPFDLVTQVFGESDTRVYHSFSGRTLVPPGVLLKVRGGIGNQLFQFACSYALAKSLKWPLYVYCDASPNISSLREFKPSQRDFALDKFTIPIENLTDSTTIAENVVQVRDDHMLLKTFPRDNLHKKFLTLDTSSYCQSIEYWADYQEDIRRFFQPAPEFLNLAQLQSMISRLENTESVVVHVRQGDFKVRPKSYVPLSYQRVAIWKMVKILKSRGKIPTFFVISDEIQFAKEHFKDLAAKFDFIFVSEELRNATSVQEFYLMTRAKHIILPNSTFSWWAAYLMKNENKVVIATAFNPKLFEEEEEWKRWFRREVHGKLYHPKEWIVINPFTGGL